MRLFVIVTLVPGESKKIPIIEVNPTDWPVTAKQVVPMSLLFMVTLLPFFR